jgi:hypothetical protein
MKRRLLGMTATILLALPILAGGQPTPIPPEAARETPLTTTGEQDTRPQFEDQPMARQPSSSRRQRPSSKLVMRAQEKLRELGYEPGPMDGVLGLRTKRALSKFQRDRDLPATGTLNPATRRQLLGTAGAAVPEHWRETPPTLGGQLTDGLMQVAERHLRA